MMLGLASALQTVFQAKRRRVGQKMLSYLQEKSTSKPMYDVIKSGDQTAYVLV